MIGRRVALGVWAYAAWVLLTWTPFTWQTEAFGLATALVRRLTSSRRSATSRVRGCWPTRDAWRRSLDSRPARCAESCVANLRLTRLIWTPSLPLRSGMVIVPTDERSDGGLAAVGLISSLIVDNQIVDVDRRLHLLQYHAVRVPDGGRERAREAINGPVERLLEPLHAKAR